MITNGWVDWAVRRDGPPQKVFDSTNAQLGLVCHSMEGYMAGSLGELDKPERQASWHFSNGFDGTFYQHYPLTASCWASGSFEANTRYVAIESEGMVSDGPLNALQVANFTRLVADLEAYWGFPLVRRVNLWEHNEVAVMWTPNAGPTSCPSHRYDGAFAALLEDDMTPAEVQTIVDAAVKPLKDQLDRLNEVLVKRFTLIHTASDPNAENLP